MAAELAARERNFAVAAPLVKSLISGVQTLAIDSTQTITGSAFLTGKFRLHSTANDVVRIQRFDDDGEVVTDSWQTVVQFKWNDAGGSMGVNRIRAHSGENVILEDSVLCERDVRCLGDLHVTGNVTCDGTVPSPFFCSGTFSGTGAKLASAGVAFTVVRESVGVYRISFATPHPQGLYFAVTLTAQGGSTWSGYILAAFERVDASSFRAVHRAQSGAKVDAEGSFAVFN